MQFQKHINISENTTPYQYRTKEYFQPNTRIIYQGPKIYKEEIYYELEPNSYQINSAKESDKQLEINNEENPTSKIYAIRREINSINGKLPSSQIINDRTFNSSLPNFRANIKEEIEPSPKTINIGDTKENIESNHRTITTRRTPNIRRRIISKKNDFVEYRNESFDGNRNYNNNKITYYERPQNYIIRNQRMDSPPITYLERSGNRIIERTNDGYNNSGIMPYDEQMSPYNNYDELNISNDFEGNSSDYNRKLNYGENSYDYDYRQNRFGNNTQYINQGNNLQRIRNINEYNNYNNMNNNAYQSQTMKIINQKSKNNITNNTTMSFAPKQPTRYTSNNNGSYPRDDIQEKYQNQTYNNMTYKDVKNIVNKFTRVYDPKRNDNGLLIEDSQIIVPGAEDEVFNNRYRVLNRMRRLSNILLSKQNERNSSAKKREDEFFYTIRTNNLNKANTSTKYYYEENNNINNDNISDNEFNARTFDRQQYDKKAKTPIKIINKRVKNKNNRFKYVSLAMMASKGVNTENRIILRRMRLEKGGVVDLASMEKRRGKYKIRKVSRSPGYKRIYYRRNPKHRENAAKRIQEWWRKIKEFMSKKILKIIKIQSVYRGRFVRKYLYDLLYLNYLYLSFCQKIESVLKKKVKPYIFEILKNYGKSKTISYQEIKDFDILKNIIASKQKKWRILNLRKGMNKLKEYLRRQQKITLALYKILKIKAEKDNNKNAILKNALRKWNYNTKLELIQLNKSDNDNIKITQVIKNQNDKIKGLFNIMKGINQYAKKSALEPTLPKIINYLTEQKIKNLLRKILNKKSVSDKEKLKEYFYKYLKNILTILNKEKEDEKFRAKPKPVVIKPKNVISKTENINLPKIYTKEKVKQKPKINLKIDKTINKMEIKGKPKEITEKLIVKEIPEIKEIKNYEIENYENILLKGKEKRKDEIMKMKGRLFLYLINSARKKQNKNILRKYFNKYFKKIIQLQRKEDRKLFEEKEKEKNIKQITEITNNELNTIKKLKLMSLPKIKKNIDKNILRKYFDIWKKKTFNNKESSLKLFIKLLDIIIDNYNRNLIHKKLNQWKKKTSAKKIEDSVETEPIPAPKIEIQSQYQQAFDQELDIFNTLKNLKDIINFNDYLRNIYVNKYGKEFLNKLDRTRNPKLINKIMKRIIRKKNFVDENNLRNALNKWKNKADIEKAIKLLKTKLLFILYNKNKNNNQSNLLQKYFDRWKNVNQAENIKNEIYNLKNTQKLAKSLLLKNYIRNKDNNDKNNLMKTYLNKWKSVLKSDEPKLKNLFEKIKKFNTNKNGPEFIDNLSKNKNNNKKKELLLKCIPKRYLTEKMLLYKYLMNWRNKLNDKKTIDIYNNVKKNMLNILLNKNDKQNLAKAFNIWRYNKPKKLPKNAYQLGINKIKNLLCKKPFNDFVNKMDKTNPTKLKSKGKNFKKIIDKISKEKPYNKLINNMKILIRKNKLNDLLPKVNDKIKEYYLPKYFNKWRDNVKDLRLKNMKIITKWLRKKFDIEKDKKLKRRNELLKRIINNKIKLNKYQLIFPLRYWKKIASILTYNINARIIQRFWRRMLNKKKLNKKHNQNKLRNILLNLYKKNLIKTISEPEQYKEIEDYIKTKEENKDKLRKIFNNRDNDNNKLLLRLAIEKWNQDKSLFDKNLQILQNKIRQLISKNKLNNIKILQNILKNIIKSNDDKNKKLFKDKFIQWYLIAKKLNYHDTSKIEEFIRKIAIGRLIKKLQCTLNKYSNKYFIYLLNNIAKINKLKNTLKKKPNEIAFNEIKDYARKKNIKDLLNNAVNNKNDKYNILLLKKYLNKWNQKVNEINNKENEGALTIQKVLKGKKIKNKVNRELNIKKILTQIINRYDNNSKLRIYFMRWGRITKKISCNENARIIQNFCKTIHDKYLKLKKEQNIPHYKNLSNILINLGKNSKKDFWDKRNNLYKIKKLERTMKDIYNKRKNILKDALYKINYNNKLRAIKNIFDNTDEKNKYILKRALNKWKNKAFNNKYVLLFLTKFLKYKSNADDNLLRSILCTWLYKAMLIKIKNKEKTISLFCKDILKKKQFAAKWKDLADKLRNQKNKDDIDDIIDNLKTYKNLDILFNILKHHIEKDTMKSLRKNNYILLFKEKIENIINNLDEKENGINLKKYFDIWKNKTDKINNRLDKLYELMDKLNLKMTKDDANTISQVMLLKKLFNNIPKLYKYTTLKKIKDFSDNKDKNQKLAENLKSAKNEIKPKIVSPLIKKIYKVYAYKVLDQLFNSINKALKRSSELDKIPFMGRMLLHFSDKNKDYIYSNQIEKEKKPFTKKIVFKTKKNKKAEFIPDKSSVQLTLISPFVNLIDNMIKNRKKDSFDNIRNNFKAKTLIQAMTDYLKEKEIPNKQEFIDNLKTLKDKLENDGPQKAKLFKLLRQYAIKKTFLYKKDIYRMKQIFYLINLTLFNLEIAKSRWIRQILRKWRFISFVKKMTREKMELMYKNLHVSYLEMVNSIFSDEESKNPGVAKEFERFGNGIGMFINEDPYSSFDDKLCLGVKKQYVFPNTNLGMEKVGDITTKVEGKELVIKEKYVTNLDEAKEGDIIVGEVKEDKKIEKEEEKSEEDNEEEEGEEEEDEKDENNN